MNPLDQSDIADCGFLPYGVARASDAERSDVLTGLRLAHNAGRLTGAQFYARSDIAITAESCSELRELLRDLPGERPAQKRRKANPKILKWIIILVMMAGAGFGIYAFVSWIMTPAPLTISQSFRDGYADALSDQPFGFYPWGSHSCVTDWNGQLTGQPVTLNGWGAGFSNGGPDPTRIITYRNQDTGTKLGNAWMAGCRAGLRSLGE